MDNPAVLDAWLNERRRNFPSSGNKELKRVREETRRERGHVGTDRSYTLKGDKWAVKRHKPCLPGLAAYSDSEDEEEEGEVTEDTPAPEPAKPAEEPLDPKVEKALKKFKSYAKMVSSEGRKVNLGHKKWNGVMKSGRRRFQPTLLYKLLSADVTKEHNTVLQCIRHIVDNDFFDKTATEQSGS